VVAGGDAAEALMLSGIVARLRSYWRGLRKPEQLGAEMDDEMRFHLEMEAARRVRERGLDPEEARRQAIIAFGGVEKYKEAGRDVRTLDWVSGFSLDVKLAWRMLGKSAALTVIGVLGIALGTAVGVATFVMLSAHFFPNVPLNEGDRLVALENWDVEANRPARRSLHDFVTWHEEMRSVQPIAAAAYLGERALVTGNDVPQTVLGAAMTAAGFQIARVPPLLGRYLLPDDEREHAPPVAVIGYDLWQARFEGDPRVIGRRILVDGFDHAVIGVMPPGFAFPKNQSLWTPLSASPARHARGRGPALFVFGRLAPGATWEQAQTELTGIGRRTAAAFPGTNARLRPQLLPYTYPLNNTRALQLREVAATELMVSLLLIAVAVNVGMLVYARTAMRQGEIAVRTALGATRRRIVAQLFIEALLLSLLGAGLGLGAAHAALRELVSAFEQGGAAFWVDHGFQPRSVAFALTLAIVAAVIVGVVPGLKSTGRGLNASLQLFRSGASVRLGRTWTALIVAQVAVVVAVLPTALHIGYEQIQRRAERATFPAHEFVSATLGLAVPIQPGMDGVDHRRETAARFAVALPELERTLETDPTVAGATFHGSGGDNTVEIEGVSGVHDVGSRGVALDYFETLGARILAGRAFAFSDAGAAGEGVIVSEALVRRVLGGEPATGRRVRFVSRSETGEQVADPWLEIVGVVEDLYANAIDRTVASSVVYHAVSPGQLQAATLLVRVRGDADGFIPRLQQIAAIRDPDFRLGRISNLAVMPNSRYLAAVATGLALAMVTVLLLSAVGIHALMSLTVTRRRKEIGIRIALGANRGRLLASIFSRAVWQLGLGALVGSLLGATLLRINGRTGPEAATLLGGVVGLMLMAGLVATARPARRGVRIQPMDALRGDD
jgi:putative ABC transport system permease protein